MNGVKGRQNDSVYTYKTKRRGAMRKDKTEIGFLILGGMCCIFTSQTIVNFCFKSLDETLHSLVPTLASWLIMLSLARGLV